MIEKDEELFNIMEEKLYTAVICDILDEFGYRNNALKFEVRPLNPEIALAGRAFTVLAAEIYEVPDEPYKLEIESVDNLSDGDIYVATTNGCESAGFWGELLSNKAIERGARGAIIDGSARDIKAIKKLDFPLFVKSFNPLDSKGRIEVVDYQVPIKCGGVKVNPGDIVFGDIDGIVVIPQGIEEKVIKKALEKVEGENIVREEIKKGKSMKDVFDRYGIL